LLPGYREAKGWDIDGADWEDTQGWQSAAPDVVRSLATGVAAELAMGVGHAGVNQVKEAP
jgi:hypothetical protein